MKPADQFILGEGLPLEDVFARVTKLLGSPVLARHVMHQALAGGQVTAMEWSLPRGGCDSKKRELPAEFWRTAELIFYREPDKLYVRSPELQRNSYHYFFYLRPSGVEKLWPLAADVAELKATKAPATSPKKGKARQVDRILLAIPECFPNGIDEIPNPDVREEVEKYLQREIKTTGLAVPSPDSFERALHLYRNR
jgi:hypothetical protein